MAQLKPSLSFYSSFAIVAGSMIGTGVFLKSAIMAQWVGSAAWVLLAWAVAGLLSLIGALSYAEMGRRYPQVGGEYVYLRESYGFFPAFLFGWTRFWIASTGSVAAYGVGAATFLSGAMSLEPLGGKTAVALFFIGLFTITNCFAVSYGGKVQAVMTTIKVLVILSLIIGLGSLTISHDFSANPIELFNVKRPLASAFGMAILSALWAFDGWNNLPMAASEVKNSTKTVPLALICGTAVVLILYLAINTVFFKALSLSEVITSNSTAYPNALPLAAKAVAIMAGNSSKIIVSCFFVFSALGAMNGSILTGARVPYAMAQDGLFFPFFKKINPRSSVPVFAVALQGIWAMLLAFSGSFDQLTNYVIFSSWIFYGAIGFAVFKLKTNIRWLAFLFSLSASALLINTLFSSPKETGIGLALISLGVPFYFLFKRSIKS